MIRLIPALLLVLCLRAQTAAELSAHVEFLASDLLGGRGSASRGLDLAADYIAAQFQLAGLERVENSYFQNAEMLTLTGRKDGWELTLIHGDSRVSVPWQQIYAQPQPNLTLENVPLYKLPRGSSPESPELAGNVVITDSVPSQDLSARIYASGALGVLYVPGRNPPAFGIVGTRLIRKEAAARIAVMLYGEDVRKFFDDLPAGAGKAQVNARVQSDVRPSVQRNVVGLLRGSDVELRNTYIIVSAHYDHEGIRGSGDGDNIYNGANDDASGTAAVIAMAREFASRAQRPRRSILFMAFFGEEAGLVGSRYYGDHPLVPLSSTVAQVNLEQLGRTDDSEGPRIDEAMVTGFDYSDVAAVLAEAGKPLGVKFSKHPKFSDAFFDRSDNESLALRGVPAHTVGVAFDFPDYHKPSDHADKLDYQNFERIARALTAGVAALAERAEPPQWNQNDSHTERFRKARSAPQ